MNYQVAIDTAGSQLKVELPSATPGFITALISAIMSLLNGGCFGPTPAPAGIKTLCANPPFRVTVALHMAMRDEGIRPLSPLGEQASAAVFRLGAAGSEDLLVGLIQASQF